jgi:hypothetical protein
MQETRAHFTDAAVTTPPQGSLFPIKNEVTNCHQRLHERIPTKPVLVRIDSFIPSILPTDHKDSQWTSRRWFGTRPELPPF